MLIYNKKNNHKMKSLLNFKLYFTTLQEKNYSSNINSPENLEKFYRYITERKEALVEESDGKKPIASKERRHLLRS